MANEFGRYEPIALPFLSGVDPVLVSAIERELRAIADAQRTPSVVAARYEPQLSEPIVYEGLVAIADGTSWDPGAGAGVYVYLNGEWLFLAGYPQTSFLWKDEKGRFEVMPGASKPPTADLFRGNIYQWRFNNTAAPTENELFLSWHVDHDYAMGTPIYYHVHSACTDASPSGVVRWGFEYTVAKGHNQEPFITPVTKYLDTTYAVQYQHMITECSLANAIPATHLEPDSLIIARVWRNSSDAADTSTSNNIFGLYADLHYNIDRPGTPNKAPDFYA